MRTHFSIGAVLISLLNVAHAAQPVPALPQLDDQSSHEFYFSPTPPSPTTSEVESTTAREPDCGAGRFCVTLFTKDKEHVVIEFLDKSKRDSLLAHLEAKQVTQISMSHYGIPGRMKTVSAESITVLLNTQPAVPTSEDQVAAALSHLGTGGVPEAGDGNSAGGERFQPRTKASVLGTSGSGKPGSDGAH